MTGLSRGRLLLRAAAAGRPSAIDELAARVRKEQSVLRLADGRDAHVETAVILRRINPAWCDWECKAYLRRLSHVAGASAGRGAGAHHHSDKMKRRAFRMALTEMVTVGCAVGVGTLNVALTFAAHRNLTDLARTVLAEFRRRRLALDAQSYTSLLLLLQKRQYGTRRSVAGDVARVLGRMAACGVSVDLVHHSVILAVILEEPPGRPASVARTTAEAQSRALAYFLAVAQGWESQEGAATIPPKAAGLVGQAFRACGTKAELHMVWNRFAPVCQHSPRTAEAAMAAAARLGLPRSVRRLAELAAVNDAVAVATHLVRAYKEARDFVATAQAFRSIYEAGGLPSLHCFDVFIRMCLERAEEPDDAYVRYATEAFEEADLLNLAVTKALFSSLMEVYAKVGAAEAAARLEALRAKRGIPPSRRWLIAASQMLPEPAAEGRQRLPTTPVRMSPLSQRGKRTRK